MSALSVCAVGALDRARSKAYYQEMLFPTDKQAHNFRTWVDEAAARYQNSNDLVSLYHHFGVPNDGHGFSRARLVTHLRKASYRALSEKNGLNSDHLTALEHHLVLQHVLDGFALQPYLGTLKALQSPIPYRGANLTSFENHPAWREAVELAFTAYMLDPSDGFPDELLEFVYKRPFRAATFAKYLRSRGFIPSIEGGRVRYDAEQQGRLVDEMERLITLIGGTECAVLLCQQQAHLFNPRMGRYLVGREAGGPGADIPARIPWAYLLNLALKHCHAPSSRVEIANSEWDQLIQTATAFVATQDVQPYHPLDGAVLQSESLSEDIIELLRYDAAFVPIQANPRHAGLLIQNIFSWVDEAKLEQVCGWTVGSALKVFGAIADNSPPRGAVFFRESTIERLCSDVKPSHISRLLAALSHEPDCINTDYRLPGDHETFSTKPLIKLQNGYLLLDLALCALSFYEALFAEIKMRLDDNLGSRIGRQAETFLQGELRARGLKVCHGEYIGAKKEKRDCDVVVETDNLIVFIELKAKVLTRVSKRGDAESLFTDLAKSLLHAQSQAGLHEIHLREKGSIDLNADGGTYRLELGNRKIERFAISLHEFGPLQDHLFVKQFFSLLAESATGSGAPKDFRCRHSELVRQHESLMNRYPELKAQQFSNYWFLSISMLLSLIEDCSSGEDLEQAILLLSHLSYRTHDFYSELVYARQEHRDGSARNI